MLQANPRSDWYLLSYCAALALSHHSLESYSMFLAPLVILGSMLALPFLFNSGKRSPVAGPWAVACVIVVTGVLGLWREGAIAP